jgi:predicted ATPase/DNA-binding SARP family transcriptional activator
MEVMLLGPLEVRDGDRVLSVRGSRPRALLALLALNAGRVMAAERLIELLWGDEVPPSAANALQVHVSNLRKVLEPQGQPYRVLVSDESGYALKIEPDQIDFACFERLVDLGHKALTRGEVALCAQLLGEAANLWRGSALADLADQPWSIGEARRLEELRLAATEDRIEAELALGRHSELIAELESMIASYPFRERLRGQLMLALYRSGRQAEASDVYQKTREVLVEELGMEPGLELQQLLKAILNQEASLGVPAPERPAPRLDNLPVALTSFVGRDAASKQIRKLLSVNRLVTLTGPGGVGKTRLAVEVARGLLDKYERGVWLTSFAPLSDAALVPEAVAQVLAIRAQAGQSPTERLIASISDRQYLIVLDNCEHLVDACARMAEALLTSCPRMTILATSREALGVAGEVAWSVPSMQVPEAPARASARGCEAIELFQQRAATAVGSFQLDGRGLQLATQLCRRLDGIPLAIELAAAKLKMLSLEELLARLDDRFRVLTDGNRTAMPRQQTLRATIDWSYDLLPPTDRALFPMLSVFAGSFSLQAAEVVCSVGAMVVGDVLGGLSNLARKSLVQVEKNDFEIRYRLMDTIRQYGQEKLNETGQLAVLSNRHREFYLDLAERAAPQLRGSNGNVWMTRLMNEHDDIRAALRWSLTAGDGEKLARLALALGWFWYLRCFFQEGRRWFEAALRGLKSASPATRTQLLIGAGLLAWAQGDHGPDRVMFEEALSFAEKTGDDALIGHALLRIAVADHGAGDFESEQKHAKESIRKLRKDGPPFLLAEALNNLGWLRGVILNDAAPAALLLEESLSIARQCGDLWILNAVFDSMGNLERVQGRLDTAQAFQEQSVRTCTALGDAWSLPYNLEGFVKLASARNQSERALRIAGAAARLREDVGSIQLPGEKAQIEALIKEARAELPAAAADAAWRDGWQTTEADAVNYALSHELDSTSSR